MCSSIGENPLLMEMCPSELNQDSTRSSWCGPSLRCINHRCIQCIPGSVSLDWQCVSPGLWQRKTVALGSDKVASENVTTALESISLAMSIIVILVILKIGRDTLHWLVTHCKHPHTPSALTPQVLAPPPPPAKAIEKRALNVHQNEIMPAKIQSNFEFYSQFMKRCFGRCCPRRSETTDLSQGVHLSGPYLPNQRRSHRYRRSRAYGGVRSLPATPLNARKREPLSSPRRNGRPCVDSGRRRLRESRYLPADDPSLPAPSEPTLSTEEDLPDRRGNAEYCEYPEDRYQSGDQYTYE
eukprot:762717_1